ncbi:MAG: hypothetical protein LBK66_07840 [Spirochaetaceae bacterium]|nr:hypothetical protein [Spirochaetaceae bacterium]
MRGIDKTLKNINMDVWTLTLYEKKLIIISDVYIESRYPGDLGLLPDGMPTNEQAKVFIEYNQKNKVALSWKQHIN